MEFTPPSSSLGLPRHKLQLTGLISPTMKYPISDLRLPHIWVAAFQGRGISCPPCQHSCHTPLADSMPEWWAGYTTAHRSWVRAGARLQSSAMASSAAQGGCPSLPPQRWTWWWKITYHEFVPSLWTRLSCLWIVTHTKKKYGISIIRSNKFGCWVLNHKSLVTW